MLFYSRPINTVNFFEFSSYSYYSRGRGVGDIFLV